MKKVKILDHGFVELIDHMGNDNRIVDAARVSTRGFEHTDRELSKRGSKLIHFLMKSGHTSPFEQVVFLFHCKMPIFIARQWVRHRTARINELSGRYKTLPREYYVPSLDRIQGQNNKIAGDLVKERITVAADNEMELYNSFLKEGIPKELSRINLPLSTYTEWIWQIDLHNLFHFLELRLHKHAQFEIREYAKVIYELIKPIVPIACEAFEEYRLEAVTLSRTERIRLLSFLEEVLGNNEVTDIITLLKKGD